MPGIEDRRHKGINSRAENLRQPTRRKRIVKQLKPPRQVQRFLSVQDPIANVLPRRTDHATAADLRSAPSRRLCSME